MTDERTGALKPIKWYKSLATRKGRLESGAFLIEGERAIRQIIAANPDRIIEIISTVELPSLYRKYWNRLVTESQMRSICSTKTPQGMAALARLPLETYSHRLPENVGAKILLLEDVQNPGNMGTLIRTAAAFDFSGVILTEKCADPFSPKCLQSTAGSVLSLWLRRTSHYLELTEELKKRGYPIIATDINGTGDTAILQNRNGLVLALGNEGSGLSDPILKISDYRLRIPTVREKAESLNVAICGAICMYLSCNIS